MRPTRLSSVVCLLFSSDKPCASQAARRNQLAEIFHALLAGDCLLRALPRPGIGPCTLAADWQPQSMPHAPVAFNIAQAADVLAHLATKLTFDNIVLFKNRR